MDASLTIIRRPVKHARLRVRQDSSVELVVPEDWQAGEINRLLGKKAAWIQEKQTYFRMRERGRLSLANNEVMLLGEPFRIETDERLNAEAEVDRAGRRLRVAQAFVSDTYLREWQREFAKTFLLKRTRELSEKHGLKFGRLFVRSQRTKWGSCSAKQNISLNWRLISAPELVIDYVIFHELLHTKMMNHSQTFWVHLHALCPWAKEAVAWLNTHQPEPDLKPQLPEV
jgi:predicted metal-dependent hydrolase